MVAKSLIVLLCLCFSWCFGQPAVVNRRAMLISGLATGPPPFTPLSVPGMAYRWQTNSIKVDVNSALTNWIDDIQGLILTNSGSLRPTLTSTGVYFGNAQILTNAGINPGQTLAVSMLIVISRDKNDTLHFFTGDGVSHGHLFDRGILSTAAWEYETATPANCSGNNSKLATNAWMTLIHDATGTAGGANQHYYTNGILANTFNGQEAEKILCIGGKADGGQYLSGTILELCLWTNVNLASYAAQLHQYATNRYGFTAP